MNPFVNPRKRSVLLPYGCKDLMDVLQHAKGEQETGNSTPVIRPEVRVGGLEHVHEYVTKLLATAEHGSVLAIGSLDGHIRMALERSASGLIVYPMMGIGIGETENHVEEFFESHAIQPSVDFQVGLPGMSTRVLGFSLPVDQDKASEVMIGLLNSVFGFDAESEIEFVYLG